MKKLLVVLAVLFASVAAYATDPVGYETNAATQDAKITVDVICPLEMTASQDLYWRLLQGTVLEPTEANEINFDISGCHWGSMNGSEWDGSQLVLTYTITPMNTYAVGEGVELTGDVYYTVGTYGVDPELTYTTGQTIGGAAVGPTEETVDFTADDINVRIVVNTITVATDANVTPGYYNWDIDLEAYYFGL